MTLPSARLGLAGALAPVSLIIQNDKLDREGYSRYLPRKFSSLHVGVTELALVFVS